MKPASAIFREYLLPIDLAGLELGNRGVATIGAAQSRTNAIPAFGKVQAIPKVASYAVVWHPAYVLLRDPALQHKVFDQSSDRVVGKRRDDRSFQAKAAPQPTRHVVLTAALPYSKLAGGGDPPIARIEPK